MVSLPLKRVETCRNYTSRYRVVYAKQATPATPLRGLRLVLCSLATWRVGGQSRKLRPHFVFRLSKDGGPSVEGTPRRFLRPAKTTKQPLLSLLLRVAFLHLAQQKRDPLTSMQGNPFSASTMVSKLKRMQFETRSRWKSLSPKSPSGSS